MMMKMNLKDRNKAMAFAIYEMVGSYYDQPSRLSRLEESGFLICFREESDKSQDYLERETIRFCEKVLLPQLPPVLWQEQPKVVMRRTASGYQVQFWGSHYLLCVSGVDGDLDYQVYHRRAAA